jgi:hypothetical protein
VNNVGASSVFSLAEIHYLRLEAMDRFERCLTEGYTTFLEEFVQQQIAQDPPRVELLREVGEDLHQRLLVLRENHFDVRARVLTRLRDDYSVDLSPLVPLKALESYHKLNADEAVYYMKQRKTLTNKEEANVRKTLEASFNIAEQLYRDVVMTEYLYDYVMDWVMGLNAAVLHHFWADAHFESHNELVQ